jgi:ABC-type uncharacterized transport system fused permease/ATPase subunit
VKAGEGRRKEEEKQASTTTKTDANSDGGYRMFWSRIGPLMRIGMFPRGWLSCFCCSGSSFMIIMLTVFYACSAAMLLSVSYVSSQLNSMFTTDDPSIPSTLLLFIGVSMGQAVFGAVALWIGSVIGLNWRLAIVQHFHRAYLAPRVAYMATELDGRLDNIDQRYLTSSTYARTLALLDFPYIMWSLLMLSKHIRIA